MSRPDKAPDNLVRQLIYPFPAWSPARRGSEVVATRELARDKRTVVYSTFRLAA